MQLKWKIALMTAVLAFLCLVGWSSKAEHSSRSNWEYKAIVTWRHPNAPPENLKQLNDLGDEGWELVTVTSEDVVRATTHQLKFTYYFKRPL